MSRDFLIPVDMQWHVRLRTERGGGGYELIVHITSGGGIGQ